MASSSPHLTNIPEAVRIAASTDPNIDAGLKQQAIDYLNKVRELCEETWQDCLALYLQGAGAPGPSSSGRDGKEKLGTDLRMYCEQVVDVVLLEKPDVVSTEAQHATYQALMEFVRTEWIDGPCEGGQPFLRNKLSSTLAYLCLDSYPNNIPTFLHPFFELLTPNDPSSSKAPNFHPILLAVRLLIEIANEIHDNTIKSARSFSQPRLARDGLIRDSIRSSGDERLAVDGLLRLVEMSVGVIESGGEQRQKWLETGDLALKALSSWIPWIDLSVSLTPRTLSFYHQLLHQPAVQLRTTAAGIMRTFVTKGIKEPADKLEELKVLDVVTLLETLEAQTRDVQDDPDLLAFRAALGSIYAGYGVALIELEENSEAPENVRLEAADLLNASLPLLLRFISDRNHEVPMAVSGMIGDLLRTYKKYHCPTTSKTRTTTGSMPPPSQPLPLPDSKRQFLSSLLDVLVRQLAWPQDADWEAPGAEDPDPGDDMAQFQQLRIYCRAHIEHISSIDKSLHTEVVANIVGNTLNTLQRSGASAVPWQQAELALHLVYTFGEMAKNNTRAAFFELPAELLAAKDRARKDSFSGKSADDSMSSGRNTPVEGMNGTSSTNGVHPPVNKSEINYQQFPLTPLGQLLTLCIESGVASYPHPSVTLQYFEICVRYVDFWKSRSGSIQPVFEAMLDSRGIHHPDEHVRRRCFYLFWKFVKECRTELDPDIVPPILQSMRDIMTVNAQLPEPDLPEERPDMLRKATTGKSYFQDQLYAFDAAGILVYTTKTDGNRQMQLLEAIAGPLMSAIGSGLERYRQNNQDLQAVLDVHHNLLALGNFAKGFPSISDRQLETLPYTPAFKQMTEALLQALDVMKTQRVVRDSARFSFSQFVSAIGSTVAELVPQFVSRVVTEFETTELTDFMTFLCLLMHRLKAEKMFETIDMLLLPLLSRIFSVLSTPATGTDDVQIQRSLKSAYLQFFTALMNANLDGVFISDRNKPEFENVLSTLLNLANEHSDTGSQRLAFGFFSKSVIAWGTSPEAANAPSVFADSALSAQSKAVANGTASATNQHAVPRQDRAAQAVPGYEAFIYQRLVPLCFEVPASDKFQLKSGQQVLFEVAMLLRNTLQARGQEAVDFLLNDLLPKMQCPPNIANELIQSLRTQQSKDFRKTFSDFIRAMKS